MGGGGRVIASADAAPEEDWLADAEEIALRRSAITQPSSCTTTGTPGPQALPVFLAPTDIDALLQCILSQHRTHEARVEEILVAHSQDMRVSLVHDLAAVVEAGARANAEAPSARAARTSGRGADSAGGQRLAGRGGADHEGRYRADDADRPPPLPQKAGATAASAAAGAAGVGVPAAAAAAAASGGVKRLPVSLSEDEGAREGLHWASVDEPPGWSSPPPPPNVPMAVLDSVGSIVDNLGSPPVVAWLDSNRTRRTGSAESLRRAGSADTRPGRWAGAWTPNFVASVEDDTRSQYACRSSGHAGADGEHMPRRPQTTKPRNSRSRWFRSSDPMGLDTQRGGIEFASRNGRSTTTDHQDKLSSLQNLQHWTRRLVCNRRFEFWVAVLILANAACIGLEADWSLHNLGMESPPYMEGFEYFFAFVFTLELLFRMIAEGRNFANPENASTLWNLFDVFVVLTSWTEKILGHAAPNGKQAGILKLLQIFRLIRILRIIRVMRFFKELRQMVQGIGASLKPLVWSIVLLCLVMFTFGVFIVQTVAGHLLEIGHNSPIGEDFLRYFGGLGRTIYTLYASIIGGIDWDDAAQFLLEIHPLMAVMFSAYVAFAVLCMLNIVTGVFVEHANAITKADADNMVMEELCAQEKRLAEMRAIFERMTEFGEVDDERLTFPQFQVFAENEKVQAYFRKIGLSIDHENAHALFTLIDFDNDGHIDLEEFLTGCTQFIGAARQLDIARLRKDNTELREIVRGALMQLGAVDHRASTVASSIEHCSEAPRWSTASSAPCSPPIGPG